MVEDQPPSFGGLEERHWRLIREVLRTEPAVERAALIGSRAMGTHSPFSDVDLVLSGDGLDLPTVLRLRHRFEESRLPVEVGISRLKPRTHPPFRAHVERWGRDIPLDA